MSDNQLGEFSRTQRGFDRVEFKDTHRVQCRVQESSACVCTDDPTMLPGYLWLGVNVEPKILRSKAKAMGLPVVQDEHGVTGWQPYPLPEEVLNSGDMHLSAPQVRGLVKLLQQWLETGSLEPVEATPADVQQLRKTLHENNQQDMFAELDRIHLTKLMQAVDTQVEVVPAEQELPWMQVADSDVRAVWKCENSDCEDQQSCELPPTYYKDNGTPVCDCDEDMCYQRTEIKVPPLLVTRAAAEL